MGAGVGELHIGWKIEVDVEVHRSGRNLFCGLIVTVAGLEFQPNGKHQEHQGKPPPLCDMLDPSGCWAHGIHCAFMDALGVKPLFVFIKPLFGFFAMVAGIHFLLLNAVGSEFGIVMKLLKHGAGDAKIGVHTNEVHEFEGAHFEAAAF